MTTVPDTRLWWNKVQPILRPLWDGKAHSVIPKQLNGEGGPDRAWDLASSLWITERLSRLPTSSRPGYRAGVRKSRHKSNPFSHPGDLRLLPPTPTVLRAVAFARVENLRTSPG